MTELLQPDLAQEDHNPRLLADDVGPLSKHASIGMRDPLEALGMLFVALNPSNAFRPSQFITSNPPRALSSTAFGPHRYHGRSGPSPTAAAKLRSKVANRPLADIMHKEHKEECKVAAKTFPPMPKDTDSSYKGGWDAFPLPPEVTVSPGNAPYNTDRLMLSSKEPLISAEDCQAFITMAQMHGDMKGWDQRYPIEGFTQEVNVADIPEATELLNKLLASTLLPAIGEQFPMIDPTTLRVTTALIIKYNAASGDNNLPVHQDHSLFTMNLALSDGSEYEGGGAWFQHTNDTYILDKGKALLHAGRIVHSGVPVTSGVRHQLVMFLLSTEHPDLCETAKSIDTQLQKEPDEEDTRMSVKVLEEGLRDNDRDCDSWSILARHYYTLGKVDDSMRAFQKVIDLSDGRDFNALYALSKLHNEKGQYEEELSALQRAWNMRAPPGKTQEMENLRVQYKVGMALFNLERYPEASVQLLKVVAQRQDFIDAWETIAVCMSKLGKEDKAAKFQAVAESLRRKNQEVVRGTGTSTQTSGAERFRR